LFEVFEVELSDDLISSIRLNLSGKNSRLYLATLDEIRDGRTYGGEIIAKHTKSFLAEDEIIYS